MATDGCLRAGCGRQGRPWARQGAPQAGAVPRVRQEGSLYARPKPLAWAGAAHGLGLARVPILPEILGERVVLDYCEGTCRATSCWYREAKPRSRCHRPEAGGGCGKRDSRTEAATAGIQVQRSRRRAGNANVRGARLPGRGWLAVLSEFSSRGFPKGMAHGGGGPEGTRKELRLRTVGVKRYPHPAVDFRHGPPLSRASPLQPAIN